MSYLLDTNVISEFVNASPNLAVQRWLAEHEAAGLFLSVITVGEIQQGIIRLSPSKKRERLQNWLQNDILATYGEFILPVDRDTMLAWGTLTGGLIKKGWKMSVMDSLIAATAVQHNLKLVTRNDSDFLHTGLELINPWVNI